MYYGKFWYRLRRFQFVVTMSILAFEREANRLYISALLSSDENENNDVE